MEVGLTVILYDKDATEFDDNGLCVLNPAQCSVAEIAGGKYELHLEHPYDEYGKYTMLAEDYLIKAPVPPVSLPEITLPALTLWKTNKATDLYSKLPVTKYPTAIETKIQNVRDNVQSFYWTLIKYYNYGDYAVLGNVIYQARQFNFQVAPNLDSSVWAQVGLVDDPAPSPTYDPGVVEESLAANEKITKIADYSGGWIRARSIRGKVGYVKRDDCDETTETQTQTIPAQNITDQVFRIYNVSADDEARMVSVDARHISYDFQGNALYDCVLTDATPADAIAILQGSLMIPDSRAIGCNITDKSVTADWSFKNPISALLDPDEGLLKAIDGNLYRNNNNFYLLDLTRTGITLKYGLNLRGVKWTRNNENVITRIVPRCNNGADNYIYLEDMYVDSPYAALFPYPRIYVMDCKYAVGEKHEKPDGTTITWDEDSCRTQMQADAEAMFENEHVDGVDVTLDVNFLLVGDTEEYKQYRGLQTVRMYDTIKVQLEQMRNIIEINAMVTEYQWDCLRKRFYSVRLGTVKNFNRRISGYRVVNQSITYDKLSPDLINRIRSANASASTSSGSGGGISPGGDGYALPANTKNDDGIVTKGNGQANKVWKTDAQGNPDWRDDSTGSVSDGDPTLSWGTRSKVGTVSGTDLHVTMPSNPAEAGIFYGTCSTAAATQEKAVTISGITSLYDGLHIRIKFDNAQTYNGQPQLNLNSTGAVGICVYGTTAAQRYEWRAGEVVDFVYDGSRWMIVDGAHATTSYWGLTKLYDALDSTSVEMALTANQGKTLEDRITKINTIDGNTFTASTKFNVESSRIQIVGVYAFATLHVVANQAATSSDTIATAPTGFRPTSKATSVMCFRKDASLMNMWASYASIDTNGVVKQGAVSNVSANTEFFIMFVYRISSINS